jgi:aspartyl-tRNA synthetase
VAFPATRTCAPTASPSSPRLRMSFVEQEDIPNTFEGLVCSTRSGGEEPEIGTPARGDLRRHALLYGNDKPDTRASK